MLKGLTGAGIGKFDKVEEFAAMAAEYEFQAIDTGGEQLERWIQEQGLDTCLTFLRNHHMKIGSIGLNVQWRTTDSEYKAGLQQLIRNAEAAATLGCKSCVTYVLPSTDLNAAHFMVLATTRLRTCARILNDYGIRLGLEFVGPHHLRTRWKYPFIWEMSDTLDWLEAIGEPNLGLLLDAYHWYTIGGTTADIEALSASQIVHVHINDAPNIPVDQVLDNDRLYPGEGVIDLPGFLLSLKKIGYTGVVAQEILTPQPSPDSPAANMARSREAFRKVFAAASLA